MARPVQLKYLLQDVDRHGNPRIYLRRHGIGRVRLHADPGTPAFIDEYRAAWVKLERRAAAQAADAERDDAGEVAAAQGPAPAGSLAWLIGRYLASSRFAGLHDSTRRVRRQILDRVRTQPKARLPFALMEPRHVAAFRDARAEAPEAANAVVKALRQVFRWAVDPEVGLAERNPAAAVAYLRGAGEGFHTWTLDEVAAYCRRHPAGSKPRLALALLLFTGARKSDVVRLGRQNLRSEAGALWLRYDVAKGAGRRRAPKVVEIPVLPQLAAEIAAAQDAAGGIAGQLTFLQTAFGKPYTAAGFGNWFRRQCDAAGLLHCSAHGLRKAGACIAAEGGATELQLKAVFGWETMKEAERYTRQARGRQLAEAGMQAFARAFAAGQDGNEMDSPFRVVPSGESKTGKKPS